MNTKTETLQAKTTQVSADCTATCWSEPKQLSSMGTHCACQVYMLVSLSFSFGLALLFWTLGPCLAYGLSCLGPWAVFQGQPSATNPEPTCSQVLQQPPSFLDKSIYLEIHHCPLTCGIPPVAPLGPPNNNSTCAPSILLFLDCGKGWTCFGERHKPTGSGTLAFQSSDQVILHSMGLFPSHLPPPLLIPFYKAMILPGQAPPVPSTSSQSWLMNTWCQREILGI